MTLPLDLIRSLQCAESGDAWSAILDHAWGLCSQPFTTGKAVTEVHARDRSLADVDHYLATAGWDLWAGYEASVLRTSQALADWWTAHSPGRAVLILDAFSLREAPWILQQAEARGFTVQHARPTCSELPADTTPFAKALGFAQRSSSGVSGVGS